MLKTTSTGNIQNQKLKKMIKEIANKLRERLQFRGDLPFIDVYAGLVQTVSYKQETEGGSTTTKRMPVSYDTNISAGCSVSPERAIVPESTKKGIIYFEESGGASPVQNLSGGRTMWRANMVCVVWLNRDKITGDSYSEISAQAFHEIMKKLRNNEISAPFANLNVTEARFRQTDNIFQKYSYDETELQYLRPPFEYFAIDLVVSFIYRGDCVPEISINPKNC